MHIIGGRYKRYPLKLPKGIRPTSGLVRESIFNVIGEGIIGATVLDLFAGSGAVGLEAVSRGADRVRFVEKSKRVLKILRENIKKIGSGNLSIVNTDVMKFSPEGIYDIIFADPPYDNGVVKMLVHRFRSNGKLIIIEHSTREILDIGDTRRYGDTLVTYIFNSSE